MATDNRSTDRRNETDAQRRERESREGTQQSRQTTRRAGGERVNDQDYIDMNNEQLTEQQRAEARARYDARSGDRMARDVTVAQGKPTSTTQAKPMDPNDPVLPPPPENWPAGPDNSGGGDTTPGAPSRPDNSLPPAPSPAPTPPPTAAPTPAPTSDPGGCVDQRRMR